MKLRTMAFAGIGEAIHQVRELARYGKSNDEQLAAIIRTVLVTDPQQPQDVYDEMDLSEGYQVIIDQLGDGQRKDVDLTRSVSYTHLRAHETELHLVCRLVDSSIDSSSFG